MIRSQCRRVLLALLAPAFLLAPLSAWSLGMGEIDVDSALNERFDASIVLSDARDLQDSEVVVSLASREDFERVGVERFHFLTTLKFEVDTSGSDPVVRLTSNQPISEPYLNFIVEVLWPNGRLLKEYTVLLDPPTFSAAAAPQVSTPVETPTERPVQTRPARTAPPTQVALDPRPSRTPTPAREALEGEIMTTTDDTLWKIANRTRSDRVDVNQQMLAIQDLNPRAFIRNNINLLKAGYRLTLPTEAQALNMTTQEAQLAVSDQANSWRNPVARSEPASSQENELQSQVDATAESPQEVVEVESEQGQVRIVAASGDLVQGSSAEEGAESGVLLEENETLTRQVDELQYQLDREKELAANQIELKERELDVKDQELAALQQRLSELEEQVSERRQNQVTPTQPAEVPLWQSPMVLGGVIGLLILVLVFLLLRNRRSDDDVESYDDDYDESEYQDDLSNDSAIEPMLSGVAADESDQDADAEQDTEQDDVLSFDDDELVDQDDSATDIDNFSEATAADAETSDVIGEADIYVAYGRHGQAITLLKGALDKEPDRHDVRLKLLEVCVDAQDPAQFSENADYLVANCDDEDILMACRELEGRLNDEVSALEDLGSDDEATDESAMDEDSNEDEDLDLELDDDVLELDEASDEPSTATSEEDFELEFDLDDSSDAEISDTEIDTEIDNAIDDATDKAEAETLSLGGDLGMDFDPDAPDEEASDDGDFDLSDLDELEAAEDNSDANPAEEDLGDFEFDAEGEADINSTKIDLAEAYIDMGDGDGARDILSEVLEEGSDEQKARAQELLNSIG